MNDIPCPYCARLYTARLRWVSGKKEGEAVKVHDITDHDCPAWAKEPPLSPVDPAFRVIPSRSDADMAYALTRYRRAIR